MTLKNDLKQQMDRLKEEFDNGAALLKEKDATLEELKSVDRFENF